MARPIDFSDAALNDVAAQDLALATSLEKQLWVVAEKIAEDDAAYQASQGTDRVSKLQYTSNSAGFRIALETTPAAYLGALWQGIKPFAFDSPIDISAATGDAAALANLNQAQQFTFLAVKLSQLETAQNHISGPGRVGIVIDPQDGFVEINFVLKLDSANVYKLLYGSDERPPSSIQVYVSATGDDGNTGETENFAVATLGKAGELIESGGTVYIEAGTTFEGMLASSADNVVVEAYGYTKGVSNLPLISTLKDITNSNFSAQGTANVFTATVSSYEAVPAEVDTSVQPTPYVYEDDEPLAWVADVATCSSTPGSFTYDGSRSQWANGNSDRTIYVHPKGSTNPLSDNKSYQVSARPYAIRLTGQSCIVRNIHTFASSDDNGSLFSGEKALVDSCILSYSTKHSSHLGENSEYRNTIFNDEVPAGGNWSGGRTLGVIYEPTASPGATAIYDGCVFIGQGISGVIGAYVHTSDNSAFESATIKDCYSFNLQIPYNASDDVAQLNIIDSYAEKFTLGVKSEGPAIINGFTAIDHNPGANIIRSVVPGDVSCSDIAVAGTNNFNDGAFINNGLLELDHLTFVFPDSAGVVTVERTADNKSGDRTLTNSIVNTRYVWQLENITPPDIVSDSNLYLGLESSDRILWRIDGSVYADFAGLQAAHPALEVNSIEKTDPQFSGDTSTGDFSLNPASAALQSGRDWGARRWRNQPNWSTFRTKILNNQFPDMSTDGGSTLISR
ncbi:MAG: hypothetical protein AAGH78_01220 [Cyanobacteria bacterium P01_H01_bin.58]